MRLSVELVDHIFSFLVSEPCCLNTCSEIPLLSQIAERHLYHSISLIFDQHCRRPYEEPTRLSRSISKNPRILHYVRVLRIKAVLDEYDDDVDMKQQLNQFAKTLRMFPALECIKLVTSNKRLIDWPDVFRAALEDRLSLPTLKELHIVGNQDLPCSLIGNNKNIEDLFLLPSPHMHLETNRDVCVSSLPRLKSLALLGWTYHPLFLASITPYLKELRSLKCASSAVTQLPEFLEICSETLNKLDIDFRYTDCKVQSRLKSQRCYPELQDFSDRMFQTGEVTRSYLPKIELCPVPPNLQQLTLCVTAYMQDGPDPKGSTSYLPAAAKVINTFASSIRHLIIEIDLWLPVKIPIECIDFSPLAVLGPASQSIPRIDLYVHRNHFPTSNNVGVTLAQILSALAAYDDVMRSIEEGILVIHPEKTAPDYVQQERYRY